MIFWENKKFMKVYDLFPLFVEKSLFPILGVAHAMVTLFM